MLICFHAAVSHVFWFDSAKWPQFYFEILKFCVLDLLPSFSLQPKRLETAIKPKALSFLSSGRIFQAILQIWGHRNQFNNLIICKSKAKTEMWLVKPRQHLTIFSIIWLTRLLRGKMSVCKLNNCIWNEEKKINVHRKRYPLFYILWFHLKH